MNKEPDFAALFDASPYPYLLIAPDLTLIGANPAYLKATGTSVDAILGKHIFDAFSGNPDDLASTNLNEVRRSTETAISTHKSHTNPFLPHAQTRHLDRVNVGNAV